MEATVVADGTRGLRHPAGVGGGELGQPAGVGDGSCARVGEKQRSEMGKKKRRRVSYNQRTFSPGWWLQPGLKGYTSRLEPPTGTYTPIFLADQGLERAGVFSPGW